MKRRRTLGTVLSVALGIGLLWVFLTAQPTVATTAATVATESITITKYAADGTTIIDQETLTYTEMEEHPDLPVQGDGKTHYYFQGPTFDPDNLWDPDETVNLKNKGAIKGTDVKDLVELVGGTEAGDQIEIKAIDGYGDIFQHDDVYNPEAGQGKMVIAWYTKGAGDPAEPLYPDGAYVPDFGDGMQLIFLVEDTNAAGQHVFGHDDMRNYLPEDNHHYFYSGGIRYPSSNGISIKYVSEINVYTEAPEPWSIDVTGAVTTPVSQSWFENALACHEEVEWTDAADNVYSGLPLWWLLGLADDDYVHGLGSFNDALAEAGYDIEVKASDGYTRTFRSEDIRRSSGYIVANEINGNPLTDTYPLRLVGSALTSGRDRVGQIESINLLNIPDIDTWTLELSGAYTYTMRQSEFDSAVLCPDIGHRAVYTDGEDVWEGLPLWLLVGWVDDDDAHGPDAFNDELADLDYQVRVIATDGFSHTFDIADVARNDDIIVASTLNGDPLPEGDYPLKLVGSDLTSGKQRVGQIARIELLDLPELQHYVYMPLVGKDFSDWELELSGAMTTTLTPADFQAEATEYPVSWEHPDSGDTYSGVPLWWLVGVVDDANPDAFNDDLADLGYQVKVIALDGYFYTFDIADIARNDDIIVVSGMNGEPLPDDEYPLRLVGDALMSGGQRVKQIVRIELLHLPTVAPDWELELSGAMTATLTATDFQAEATDNPTSWEDGEGNTYSGVALWRLVGMVDDEDPTTFNDALAAAGYSINAVASDDYSRSVDSTLIADNDDIIVANQLNGQPLPNDEYPLRLVGTGLSSGQMVSMIVKIELLDMPTVEGSY